MKAVFIAFAVLVLAFVSICDAAPPDTARQTTDGSNGSIFPNNSDQLVAGLGLTMQQLFSSQTNTNS